MADTTSPPVATGATYRAARNAHSVARQRAVEHIRRTGEPSHRREHAEFIAWRAVQEIEAADRAIRNARRRARGEA